MLEQYNDKYPIGQKLQDLKNNQAAFELLSKKKGPDTSRNKPRKEPKPMRIMTLLICCFVALYLACMVLTTDLVKRGCEEAFKRNANDVIRYISANFNEDERNSLNGIYDIGATEDEYQYFSAAVYDSEGKLIAITESFLCFTVEDEKYCFVLEDYFSKAEIETLLSYARNTSDKYLIEARIDKETKELVFLQFNNVSLFSESNTIWEWNQSDEDVYDSEKMIVYQKKTPIREIFSVPYNEVEENYEKWLDNKSKGEEYTRTVSYETAAGEKQEYVISVQSTDYGLQAAMDILAPVYVAGLVLMLIGIFITVYSLRRLARRD